MDVAIASIGVILASDPQLPDAVGSSLTTAAQPAFTSGLTTAGMVSAVIAALAALVAATRLRHIRPTGESASESRSAEESVR